MKPKLIFRTHRYPGYGTPPSWEAKVIYENRLLEQAICNSEFGLGRMVAQLEAKWEREWDESEFLKLVAQKELASPLCNICGGDTLAGGTSCVQKIFCTKCKHLIPEYQAKYAEDMRIRQEHFDQQEVQRKEEEKSAALAKIHGAFYWKENWFFKRGPDGAVSIMHLRDGYLDPDISIPANEWATIVSSVSAEGETSESFRTAMEFHNAVVRK